MTNNMCHAELARPERGLGFQHLSRMRAFQIDDNFVSFITFWFGDLFLFPN